jgi:hypothetical protein
MVLVHLIREQVKRRDLTNIIIYMYNQFLYRHTSLQVAISNIYTEKIINFLLKVDTVRSEHINKLGIY